MTLLLYGTALRDLHDDGMCPPVKGVNMRRKQNACDSNGGVHTERLQDGSILVMETDSMRVSARFLLFPILCISSSIEACTSCACSVGKIFSVNGV